MSTTDITRAAFQRLNEFTYSPQPAVLWPGLETRPPNSGMWLEPEVFHDEPENVSWNDDSCVNARGFFQILVHYRPGEGQSNPVVLADALTKHFPKGLSLGPVRVSKRPWQAAPVVESDDLYIPITIPFRGLS